MRAIGISGIMLAGLISVGAANGQSTPPADDPHHPKLAEGTVAPTGEVAAPDDFQPNSGAQMGTMMSLEMMQMMMQMMAQHHSGGEMAMPSGPSPMGANATGPDGLGTYSGLAPLSIFGLGTDDPLEMTPELVQGWLQDRLDRLGNPRLKLGDIGTAADGTITAEIRTTDGALVQKLAFNRFPGLFRQID